MVRLRGCNSSVLVCVCVCACVCERERVSECVCVCVGVRQATSLFRNTHHITTKHPTKTRNRPQGGFCCSERC
jgi:hypothetical protein